MHSCICYHWNLLDGRVCQPAASPRSYVIETPSGEIRRNQNHLNVLPNIPAEPASEIETPADSQPAEVPRRIATRSQTGVAIKLPERLTYKGGDEITDITSLWFCVIYLYKTESC